MEKRYFSLLDMGEYLGLPKATIYAWTSQRRIPHLKIGKRLKFDIIEIEKWLKEKRVKELS